MRRACLLFHGLLFVLLSHLSPAKAISEKAANYRFRAQAAVNLGGWLVTERWLKPSVYDCTGNDKQGELNWAAFCSKEQMEQHWER